MFGYTRLMVATFGLGGGVAALSAVTLGAISLRAVTRITAVAVARITTPAITRITGSVPEGRTKILPR